MNLLEEPVEHLDLTNVQAKEKKFRIGAFIASLLVVAVVGASGIASAVTPRGSSPLFDRTLESKGGGGGSTTCYTSATVATHNSAGDCWLNLYGSVYDLSSYANSHPGGSTVINNNCGKDARSAFETEHSQSLLNKYSQYKIGVIGTTCP